MKKLIALFMLAGILFSPMITQAQEESEEALKTPLKLQKLPFPDPDPGHGR
jgi:biopolymer transport protein ExbB